MCLGSVASYKDRETCKCVWEVWRAIRTEKPVSVSGKCGEL